MRACVLGAKQRRKKCAKGESGIDRVVLGELLVGGSCLRMEMVRRLERRYGVLTYLMDTM